jgi:hypothetical protein
MKAFAVGRKVRAKIIMCKTKEEADTYRKQLKGIADVHRQNCAFFFGSDPATVSDEIRNSVKAVVFGLLYGKGPGAIAEDIKGTKDKAKEVIDLFFEKFDSAGKWIKVTIKTAQKTCEVISPLGRVRHLWCYLHHDESLRAAMDRRGPNSSIQGSSSDIGFEAARSMQKLSWNLFVSQGQPFSLTQHNVIHDAAESSSKFRDVPMAMYVIHHAFTSRMHKLCRKTFDFPIRMDFAIDFELGAELSNLAKTVPRSDSIQEVVRMSIEEQKKLLGTTTNVDKVMRDVKANADLVHEVLKREIKKTRELESEFASEVMLINPNNALKLGYRFADEFVK